MRKMFGVCLALLMASAPVWAGDAKLAVSVQCPVSALEADLVAFTATATGGVAPYTYTWSFGDGGNGTDAATGHTYPDNGLFMVTLTVTDAAGNTASAVQPIAVANVPPTVRLGAPKSGMVDQPIEFTSIAQDASVVDEAFGLPILWDFGDGAISTRANPKHVYSSQGQYTVSLVAFDRDGGVSVAAKQAVTIASPVSVTIGPEIAANEGSPATFAGSASGGIPPYTYSWAFGDGGTATEANPAHAYADNGTYSVSLTVTDSFGQTVTAIAKATIANVPPTVAANGPTTGNTGQAISFTATATDPSPADTKAGFAFNWNFGDGATATGASVNHAYATAGTFAISVTAIDKDGGVSSPATLSVTLRSASGLNVDAGPDASINEGSTFTFSPTITGGTGPYTYSWNFGDGTFPGTVQSPKHIYKDSGVYTALIAVTDSTGATATDTVQINAGNVAPVVTVTGPPAGNTGAPLTFVASIADPSPSDWQAGFSYSWDFGDGQTATQTSINDVISHAYGKPGNYTVKATATDKDGATSVASAVTVTVSAPTIINIDQAWLDKRTSTYVLDQSNATYVLQADITVPGTAFRVAARNVTLDLNGHAITYDNNAAITVPNGGFETGDLSGWDTSGSTTAQVVDARRGMWGAKMLHAGPFAAAQTILSSPVPIPQAGISYVASITPRTGSYDTVMTLSVVDSVTKAVLATAKSANPNRGFSPVTEFTPATTNPVILKIDVTPPNGKSDYLDLDYAAVMRSYNYGIVQGATGSCPNFTVKNGAIIQAGNAYGSAAVRYGASRLTVDSIRASIAGMDSYGVQGLWGEYMQVTNSAFTANLDRLSNRMVLFSLIDLSRTHGTALIEGNTLSGTTECGIVLSRYAGDNAAILIRRNTINHTAICTEGYGIVSNSNFTNFEIAYNSISPPNGRGILLDNYAVLGSIHDNTLNIQEKPNLEYDGTSMEATGLRMRPSDPGYQRNLFFSNNVFAASTGVGGDWAATGARIAATNKDGIANDANIVFIDNVFKAILTGIDPNYGGIRNSKAWGASLCGITPGVGMVFKGNTFESNSISLNIGDNDSWVGVTGDVLLAGNTIKKSDEGIATNYYGVMAGDWENEIRNVLLLDTQYANGATADITFTGSRAKNLSVGRVLTLTVVDADNNPVPAAQIHVQSVSGATLSRGVTGVSGRMTVPLATDVYSVPANGNNAKPVHAVNTPITITASRGGKSGSVTVTTETSVSIIIP